MRLTRADGLAPRDHEAHEGHEVFFFVFFVFFVAFVCLRGILPSARAAISEEIKSSGGILLQKRTS